MGLFGQKKRKPESTKDMGQAGEELSSLLVTAAPAGDLKSITDALGGPRFSAGAKYAVLTAFLIVATRVESVADRFRASVAAAEGSALPGQAHLEPALRSAVAVITSRSLAELQVETAEEVAFVTFMLTSAIAFNASGCAALVALKDEGYWAKLSGHA